MSHFRMKRNDHHYSGHNSRIFCANCCRPLFSLSQQHSSNPAIIINIEEQGEDGKNEPVVIRQISIDLAYDMTEQQQQQCDPEITQQPQKPSINISIQAALSSIYKLDYLNELVHLNLVQEKYYDEHDDDEIGLCHVCANELENLYQSYYKFNELRQLNSHLARKIHQLDTIVKSIRTAHDSQDVVITTTAAAAENVDKNDNNNLDSGDDDDEWNDESMPVEIYLNEGEDLNPIDKESTATPTTVDNMNKKTINCPNNNNDDDEIKPSVQSQTICPGPWVKIRRLTPKEILDATTTTRPRRKVQSSNVLTYVETDDGHDEYNSQDDPDFNMQQEDNIDRKYHHSRRTKSKNSSNSDPVSSFDNQTAQHDPCHCTICDAPFTSSDDLFNHLISIHVAITLPKSWGCPLCDQVYVAKASLETHIRGHLDYKPFTCPVSECQKPFTALSYMKRHMQTWHPDHSQSTYKSRSSSQSKRLNNSKSRVIIPSSRIPDPVTGFGRKKGPISFLKATVGPPDPGPSAVCSLCQITFPNTADLVTHLFTLHRPQKSQQQPPSQESPAAEDEEEAFSICYVCPLCVKAFTSEDTWKIHVHAHLQYKPYSCPRCVLKFSCKSYLKRHMANSSPRSRCIALPCIFCSQHFGGLHHLERHYKNEHVGRFPFSCSVCEKGAYNKKELQKHERSHLDKPYTCPKCDHHQFVTEDDLALHAQDCPGRKGYVCDKCGRAYTTREGMLKHAKVHRGETFYCEQCGKGFGLLKSLKSHLKMHVNYKAYVCQICFKSFNTTGNLKAHHEGIHSTSKSHLCQECGKGFGNARSLQRHQMAHSDYRPFVCTWEGCDRTYKTLDSLKTHEAIHTGVKDKVCPVCGRNFFQTQNLRKHLKTHRQNDITAAPGENGEKVRNAQIIL